MAAYYSFDDLVQDGYFTWYRIVSGQMTKGPRKQGDPVSAMHAYKYITSRPHIMSLFQTAFRNHITDLANNRTANAPFNEVFEDYMDTPDDEHATVEMLTAGAPEPVQKVLSVFTTEAGCAEMAKPYSIVNGHRETTNDRLCRLTGIAGNVVSAVKAHFLGNPVVTAAKPKPTQNPYAALRQRGESPIQALTLVDLADIAGKIAAKRGNSLRGKTAATAIACGKWLLEAKDICRRNGILFLSFLKDHCAFAERTARTYMWLARVGAGINDIRLLSIAAARRLLLSPVPAV
jgi:hypothetical protein